MEGGDETEWIDDVLVPPDWITANAVNTNNPTINNDNALFNIFMVLDPVFNFWERSHPSFWGSIAHSPRNCEWIYSMVYIYIHRRYMMTFHDLPSEFMWGVVISTAIERHSLMWYRITL